MLLIVYFPLWFLVVAQPTIFHELVKTGARVRTVFAIDMLLFCFTESIWVIALKLLFSK